MATHNKTRLMFTTNITPHDYLSAAWQVSRFVAQTTTEVIALASQTHITSESRRHRSTSEAQFTHAVRCSVWSYRQRVIILLHVYPTKLGTGSDVDPWRTALSCDVFGCSRTRDEVSLWVKCMCTVCVVSVRFLFV